jgi:GTP-binding protein Era
MKPTSTVQPTAPSTIPPKTPHAGFVAIIGRPNVGKSTILNALLEAKVSIVTPKAQTTRERVLGILTVAERAGQIVFIDTPGIHKAREGGINAYMVEEAQQALASPNAVWYLIDPATALSHEQEVLSKLKGCDSPVFLLLNKMDLLREPALVAKADATLAAIENAARAQGLNVHSARLISAHKRRGLFDLLEDTWKLIPESPFFFPTDENGDDPLSDKPMRFFVAEKIREQLYLHLGEELPYSCAVEIDLFDESQKPPRIEATIHVERDSQKGMVIGKAGTKIKDIGTHARREVETFMGAQVFLGLKVKLLKDWTRDPLALKRFGYKSERRK